MPVWRSMTCLRQRGLRTDMVSIPTNPRFEDLRGRPFGRLTPVEYLGMAKKHPLWRCSCACGGESIVRSKALKEKRQISCGCYQKEIRGKAQRIHGDAHNAKLGKKQAPEYGIWRAMKERCSDPKNRRFDRYGGRGIEVCERWLVGDGRLSGYQCFLLDMGRRPAKHLQIDRKDFDGHYEPSNCRWATAKEQQRNRSTNRYVTFRGERMALAEACDRASVSYNLVRDRLDRKWTFDRAISEPHAWWNPA